MSSSQLLTIFFVSLSQSTGTVIRPLKFRIAKRPAFLVPERIDNGQADGVDKAFELSKDDGAAGPGTGERNVKMITTGRGGIRS